MQEILNISNALGECSDKLKAVTVHFAGSKRNLLKGGSLYYLQPIILLQLSVAYALQRDFQFKGEGVKKKHKSTR